MTTATFTTTERYIEFLTKVATNPELERQLEGASDGAAIVELAAVNGYVFTVEELKSAAREAKIMADRSEGELSEEDLAAVAGGFPGLGKIVHAIRKGIDWLDDKLNGKK